MKFTTLLTKSAMAIALVLGSSASYVVAEEAAAVDCKTTAAINAFKLKSSESPSDPALACVTDHTAVATNQILAKKMLGLYCAKKTYQASGSAWKTKKADIFPQEDCDKIGATLDCAAAHAKCKKKEPCIEKLETDKNCKIEGVLDGVKAAAEAAAAAAVPVG